LSNASARRSIVPRKIISLFPHRYLDYALGVSGRGWAIRPFSGRDARADGLAAIGYDLDELPASRARPDAYAPEYLGVSYEPPLGIGSMRLVVEIDSGSEGAGRQVRPFDRSSAARFVISCSNLEREPYSPMILLSHNW
jgi:hypothetical protein